MEEKYNSKYNEVPLMDLRIVDNIERSRNKWVNKAMQKFISLTESIHDDDNDNNNCPSGIPHHNCPRSKEITINNRYIQPPQYVTSEPTFIHAGIVTELSDYPHPSNHSSSINEI